MIMETLPRPCSLPAGLAGIPAEYLSFAGRVLAFTHDERGRCDGFVLELGGNSELCFECREAAIQATLHRAFEARRPMTILAAVTSPRRPVAILPGEP